MIDNRPILDDLFRTGRIRCQRSSVFDEAPAPCQPASASSASKASCSAWPSATAWATPAKAVGNGALMRIAPVLIPHLKSPTAALWTDAALAAMLTHNDPVSTAACVAFAAMLWDLLRMDEPPEPAWWLDSYVRIARGIEGDAIYQPRGGTFEGYSGPVWRFADEHVRHAFAEGLDARVACDRWYSGAFLLETVPSVLYILMRHGHDPEEAIVRAVNDTRDNDTIGAIVGAAVGALHGREGLPARWLDGLSGRTETDDDGRMFELLEAAQRLWNAPPRAK